MEFLLEESVLRDVSAGLPPLSLTRRLRRGEPNSPYSST